MDVKDPLHPEQVGFFDTKMYANGIVVTGKYAYIITSGFSSGEKPGLYIVDISDPLRPSEASSLGFDMGMPRDIVLDNGIVYIANEFGAVLVDVSNPMAPVQVSSIDFSNGNPAKAAVATCGIAVSNHVAYITHVDRLEIVDVSNPHSPIILGGFNLGSNANSVGVTIGGDYAYVTTSAGLQVVDISDPKNPTGVASYQLSVTPQRVAFSDNTVYLADAGAGLLALDVSNPSQPVQSGLLGLPGYAFGLTTSSNYVYVADGEGGLFTVEDVSKSGGVNQTSDSNSGMMGQGKLNTAGAVSMMINATEYPASKTENELPITVTSVSENTSSSSGHTIIVNSIADSGSNSLRWALGNAKSGDTINFGPNIFPPGSPAVIQLASGLVLNKNNVTIDASNAGVILDGSKMSPNTVGLTIQSSGNTIEGLQIINCPGDGIQVSGNNNIIGGDRSKGVGPSGEGNLISGNDYGIMINSKNNRVIGNYVGTDLTGTKMFGNNGTGVIIKIGSQNIIGGTSETDRNVISGNGRTEVSLMAQSNANTVIGNYIGTDASGEASLGNVALAGVSIEVGSFNNIVERNVISNENQFGVIISDWGSWYNQVIGNYIGLDATGTVSLGTTGAGIGVGASYNKIGGTTPEERNIISGNSGYGVKVGWQSTSDVLVIGNYIGTDVSGTKSIANGIGVSVEEGTRHSFVGGNTSSEQNLISGNNQDGVTVQGMGTDYNFVTGNDIGTDVSGTNPLPNDGYGVSIKGGDYNFIQKNLIAHNQQRGIIVSPGEGNQIYLNDLIMNGNKSNGIDEGTNNIWDNGRQGNYWDDYAGTDNNGDGIGDTPYKVFPNGVDNYPLMKPSN